MLTIDTSEYNGVINWDVTAPLVEMAFCKATGSRTKGNEDPQFCRNWQALEKHPEIARGAYYYWYADDNPATEAQRFLDLVKPGPTDFLAIDLEDQDTAAAKTGKATGNFWKPIKTWMDAIEKATGHKPFIYTSPGWWMYWMCQNKSNKLIAPDWSKDYPLWLAHYTADSAPLIPPGFSKWLIWQYGSGPVKGCGISAGSNPNTDLNRLAKPVAEIKNSWYFLPSTPPDPSLEEKVAILWQEYELRKN